jgi:hypothetical protein
MNASAVWRDASAEAGGLPDPFTPPECDLKDFEFMPLDVRRLRDSSFAMTENPEEFRAALLLWCAAWHQVPAGSLPSDDRELANLAGFGRFVSEWAKVKDGALRGFVLCADGRLYHRVVSEKALESWGARITHQKRSAAANAKKSNRDFDASPFDAAIEQNNHRLARLKGVPILSARSVKDPASTQQGEQRSDLEGADKEPSRLPQGAQGKGREGKGQVREKEGNNISPSGDPARGTRIPEDWEPGDSGAAYAAEKGLTPLEIRLTAERFRNYWQAKSGKDATKRDWAATWRNWVLSDLDRKPTPMRPKRTGFV